jgi:chorismate mutase
MRRIVLPLLLCLPAIPACGPMPASPAATKAAPGTAFDRLLGLMRSRLAVMHDVARRKWADKSPIEDPAREAALLRDVADRGSALGLDPTTTRAFFGAQIEAAKLVQRADFNRWEADHRGPDPEAPDLAGVLRPRIDALNRDLLAALAQAMPRLQGDRGATARIRGRADELLTGDGIDDAVRAAAIRPLLSAAE